MTGAARGIGFASATSLAKRGFSIALVDRLQSELAAAELEIRALGVDAMSLVGNVADYECVQANGRAILERFGRIDVLVNNAGVPQPKTLIEITEAEYDETIAINLKGCFSWVQAAAPAMLTQQRGRIVNISSVSAHMGANPNAVSRFAYVTAKAGILGLTRALCKELAPHVTVNAICPGSIRTTLYTRTLRQTASRDFGSNSPRPHWHAGGHRRGRCLPGYRAR